VTIIEAWEQKITKIRRPSWAHGEYVQLRPGLQGHPAVTAVLHSFLERADVPEDMRIPPREILLTDLQTDAAWEAHRG
jgi:hypothetical protein